MEGDYDKSLKKFDGLLENKNYVKRLAEVFGHEAAHAGFALKNSSEAIQSVKLLKEDESYQAKLAEKWQTMSKKERRKFDHPPEVKER